MTTVIYLLSLLLLESYKTLAYTFLFLIIYLFEQMKMQKNILVIHHNRSLLNNDEKCEKGLLCHHFMMVWS